MTGEQVQIVFIIITLCGIAYASYELIRFKKMGDNKQNDTK